MWLCLALLAGLPPLGADAAEDFAALRGEFFTPGVETRLEIGLFRAGSLTIRRHGEAIWGSPDDARFHAPPVVCRDRRTRLDRVVLATFSGGSDGAGYIRFVGLDPVTGDFRELFGDRAAEPEMGRYFLGLARPFDAPVLDSGRVCGGAEYVARRREARKIHERIRPAGDPFDLMLELEPEVNELGPLTWRALVPADLEPLFALFADGGGGLDRRTLAENETWRIERLAFYHYYNSWGLVLLEHRPSGEVRSILDLPQQDSKSYLVEPAFELLGGDRARVRLCPICGGHDDEQSFLLDLRTLRLRRASAAN